MAVASSMVRSLTSAGLGFLPAGDESGVLWSAWMLAGDFVLGGDVKFVVVCCVIDGWL